MELISPVVMVSMWGLSLLRLGSGFLAMPGLREEDKGFSPPRPLSVSPLAGKMG